MSDVAGIHAEQVTRWFEAHVPSVRPPLRFTLIAGGHSNLTYRVDHEGEGAFVLRRPPLGHVLESAHDMGREHKIISALGPTDVPVAPELGLCNDASVNDASFYVMDFVEGVVLHDANAAKPLPAEERRSIGLHTIDVLVDLHAVDPDEVGLGDLGPKEGYVARQLRRWSRQWTNSQTRELPEMDEVQRLLEKHMPEQVGTAIVHGDYRLGNFIVRDGAVAAVLDWELCTLGDALADLGYLLNNWLAPGEIPDDVPNTNPTADGGFPSPDELLERYAGATGRDVSLIAYYRALSYWRSAAIVEGVYARYLKGAYGKTDVDLTRFSEGSPRSARSALELLETL
jgi:aminoglycoside phosphotransferase (APT) family kinase protein